ncbi:MAG: hypothetical protein R2694_15220 [Ilumatobacteraceae bacterium]
MTTSDWGVWRALTIGVGCLGMPLGVDDRLAHDLPQLLDDQRQPLGQADVAVGLDAAALRPLEELAGGRREVRVADLGAQVMQGVRTSVTRADTCVRRLRSTGFTSLSSAATESARSISKPTRASDEPT